MSEFEFYEEQEQDFSEGDFSSIPDEGSLLNQYDTFDSAQGITFEQIPQEQPELYVGGILNESPFTAEIDEPEDESPHLPSEEYSSERLEQLIEALLRRTDEEQLSIIGVGLTDIEKEIYFDYLQDEKNFRDLLLQDIDSLKSMQAELSNAYAVLAENQLELQRTLKIGNSIQFAMLFGILLILGINFANCIWQRFR